MKQRDLGAVDSESNPDQWAEQGSIAALFKIDIAINHRTFKTARQRQVFSQPDMSLISPGTDPIHKSVCNYRFQR